MATILLADDDEDLRAVYATCLRAAGYEVVEAGDGPQAINAVREQKPELMILDLWMPGLSGFEVLDQLRHDPDGARVKVIVLSAQGDADARFEAFGGGASEYLVKGLSLADLLAHVRRSLDATGLAPDLA